MSVVGQCLRLLCLPVQGTQVQSLGQEDPTCHGAAEDVQHNYETTLRNQEVTAVGSPHCEWRMAGTWPHRPSAAEDENLNQISK